MKSPLWLLVPLFLAGCSVLPQPAPAPLRYDFGGLTVTATPLPQLKGNSILADVDAPDWMAGTAMYYRLGYENAANPQTYADSHWLTPPATLVAQQLQAKLAQAAGEGMDAGNGVAADGTALHVDLLVFDQYFVHPDQSVGRVSARATYTDGRHRVWRKTFSAEVPAATADARGGAAALGHATDQMADAMLAWLAGHQP